MNSRKNPQCAVEVMSTIRRSGFDGEVRSNSPTHDTFVPTCTVEGMLANE